MKIRVLTVGRSDYGIYQPLLRELESSPEVDLSLYNSGMHLSPEHGFTAAAVEKDGYRIAERIDMLLANDSAEAVSKSIGLGVLGFAQAFNRDRPDWLLVLGDRFETFAAVVAALPFKIPVAHLHGGEATFGAIDEAFRHSITKMAHVHFASNEVYGRRIVQLGEEPWRVHVTGALALDNLKTLDPMSREDLESTYALDLSRPPLLVTFHPVTLQVELVNEQIDALFRALEEVDEPVVFTLANADTGGHLINSRIAQLVERNPHFRLVQNFGMRGYFSMLRHASALVGNSSSGILEAGAFGLPVVNIGERQDGRVRGENVIDVQPVAAAVVEALRTALSAQFKARATAAPHVYDRGGAATKIIEVLKSTPIDSRLLVKRFHDLP